MPYKRGMTGVKSRTAWIFFYAKKEALDERLKRLQASYEMYIKTKIVVVYNLHAQRFEIASLAEYTGNQTTRQMVTVMGTTTRGRAASFCENG
jgi:hypothetical protein